MKSILITGATGFLGSALSHYFLQKNYSISIVKRRKSSLARLADIESEINIYNFSDASELKEILIKCRPEIVIHAACCYGRGAESYFEVLEANVHFGVGLLSALIELNMLNLTFFNIGTSLNSNVSAYALSKNQFDNWGEYIVSELGGALKFINIKLEHMYGPFDGSSKFTSYVIDSCIHNIPELPLTQGEQRRDFIYIDDLVRAFDVLISNFLKLDNYESIPIGSGEAPPLKDFVLAVHRATGSRTRLKFGALPYRHMEQMYSCADISRLKSLGWLPKVSMVDGIQAILRKQYS